MIARACAAAVIALLLSLAVPAAAAEEVSAPSADVQRAVARVIEAQLEAFKRDDEEAAFSFASPNIQRKYREPEVFMAMVRSGYSALFRPRQVEFLTSYFGEDGRLKQAVHVVGSGGQSFIGIYAMEHQPDGSWKIDGMMLLRTGTQDA